MLVENRVHLFGVPSEELTMDMILIWRLFFGRAANQIVALFPQPKDRFLRQRVRKTERDEISGATDFEVGQITARVKPGKHE